MNEYHPYTVVLALADDDDLSEPRLVGYRITAASGGEARMEAEFRAARNYPDLEPVDSYVFEGMPKIVRGT